MGQLGGGYVDGLAAVELPELLQEGGALALCLADEGAHLHAVELHLVQFKGVGIACLHALLVHQEEGVAVAKALAEHGESLVHADEVEADELRLQEYVAALLGYLLLAHRLLHLRLLAAGGVLRREVDLLTHHELALGYAGVAFREERTVLYRRTAKGVRGFHVKHVGTRVVRCRLQGEVVRSYLLEHVANGVGEGGATRAECHGCGD